MTWFPARFRALLPLLLAASSTLHAQDTVRVMYYNLLNFPSAGAANRQDSMAPIFAHVRPDVLLVQELESAAGGDAVLGVLNGLGIGTWARANYVSNTSSSNNLQNLCFYRSDLLGLVAQDEIATDLRDINEYRMERVDPATGNAVRVDLYVTHLKAGTGSTNEDRRKSAIDALNAHLAANPGEPYKVFGGDLNLYTSAEPAYAALLGDGPVFFMDPISRPGSWSNNSAYADIHTQSPRATSFGTGASGGLDDRFDHILLSGSIMADTGAVRYLPGSYDAVGNDANHFNQSINDGTNTAVPAAVADAIYQSSDHLPVILDLILFPGTPGDTTTGPPTTGGGSCDGLFFSEYLEGSSNNKALELYNPSDAPADLAGYTVSVYNNGGTSPTNTEILSGTVPAGGTYRIVNSSADAALLALADITSAVTFFNGDDAIALLRDGTPVDVIGVIGEDPGTAWTAGGGSTSEHTLVRNAAVTAGETDWSVASGQWTAYAQDDFSFFGTHTGDACAVDSCSTAAAPTGLVATVGPTGVTVAWDELPGAQKCEVSGRPLGAPNFAKLRGNVPPYAFFVPSSQLNPGTSYEWGVRCACSLSPLEVTPLSALDTFTWPLMRAVPEPAPLGVAPNPAVDRVRLEWPSAEGPRSWTVQDLSGRTMASGRLASGQRAWTLDLSGWPAGWYRVSDGAGKTLGRFTVAP